VQAEWMIDMHKRGIDGRALFDDAKLLLDKYSANTSSAKPAVKFVVKAKSPAGTPAKP
jgi:hypothetical protein